MHKLFSVLQKPNRLDEFGAEAPKGLTWYFSTTRGQIQLLHGLGVAYVVIFCFMVCLTSVTLGLPVVFSDAPNTLYWTQLLMCYVCFCIESNYLLARYRAKESHVLKNDSGILPVSKLNKVNRPDWSDSNLCHTGSSSASNENNETGWRKCTHCEVDVPPRARHCAICRTCVLKKDHHCFFTGCCIGFHNQRYFITFCFLGIVGGSWGLYNLGTYLTTYYSPVMSLQVYKYFLPVCFVLTAVGYTSVLDFLLVFLFYLHVTSTATSLYYFCWHMMIIYRGQTSYECMKGRKLYEANFWSHMRSVFGPYWLIGFFIPVPFIVNEGDGCSWIVKSKAM